MKLSTCLLFLSVGATWIEQATCLNIILTNDDGFETPLIQSLFFKLTSAGHNVVMSAPYVGQSGTSGLIQFLQPLTTTEEPSEAGTIPAGSPAIGNTTLGEQQFYVAGAVTSAVCYGIDVLAPRFFGGAPDLVLSGPNEGQNTGLLTAHSGTLGATVTAINKGIPAIALSAGNEEKNSELIAELALMVIESAYESIPAGHGLNVNFPDTTEGSTADDYTFVQSKVGWNGQIGLLFAEDLSQCPIASAFGVGVPFPGMCVAAPITEAGYPEDADPNSEYNVITAEGQLNVAVSVIEGTYHAAIETEIPLDEEQMESTMEPLNIILTNDDGFETPLIQSLFTALTAAGHNVVMSAPYSGQSGTSGLVQFLVPLGPTEEASEGGALPAGSPPLGSTTLADQQYYVAGAVTSAVGYGIDVLAPRIFGGGPDLVLSGPNEGQNTGLLTSHSGTLGATVTAINKGIPAIALSAGNEEENSELIAELALMVIERAFSSIPPGYGLNVNFPDTVEGTTAADYSFVSSKVGLNGQVGLLFAEDLTECPFAAAFGASVPFPGMCLAAPITAAGYPEDADPTSEYNVITAEGQLNVAVSVIEGTYHAAGDFEITLPVKSEATLSPTPAATTSAPKETEAPTTANPNVPDSGSNQISTAALVGAVSFLLMVIRF